MQARYFRLTHILQSQSLEEYHAERFTRKTTRFFNMRKSLYMLQEIESLRTTLEERRKATPSTTEPSPEFVRSLFEDFHAYYEERPIFVKSNSKLYDKKFPQEKEIQNLLVNIPRFYFQNAIDKMQRFLTEIGICCTFTKL